MIYPTYSCNIQSPEAIYRMSYHLFLGFKICCALHMSRYLKLRKPHARCPKDPIRGGRSRQLGLDQRLEAEKTEVSCLPAYTVVLWQVQATGCSLSLQATLQP